MFFQANLNISTVERGENSSNLKLDAYRFVSVHLFGMIFIRGICCIVILRTKTNSRNRKSYFSGFRLCVRARFNTFPSIATASAINFNFRFENGNNFQKDATIIASHKINRCWFFVQSFLSLQNITTEKKVCLKTKSEQNIINGKRIEAIQEQINIFCVKAKKKRQQHQHQTDIDTECHTQRHIARCSNTHNFCRRILLSFWYISKRCRTNVTSSFLSSRNSLAYFDIVSVLKHIYNATLAFVCLHLFSRVIFIYFVLIFLAYCM